jgi:glycosyltransferase involved in cell wall biosynthesis
MSNTFLEALSVGTPIICPARVDPDGIVARHHLGFVAADDEELSRLVDRAAALDQSAYQEQSNRSRKYVREANDPRRIARQLTDFLEAARLTRASRLEFPT